MKTETGAQLFCNYRYGMSREQVINKSGAVPCMDAIDNPLLLCSPEPVDFLHEQWQQIFTFNNLKELQQVTLSQAVANNDKCINILKALAEIGWQPVLLEAENAVLDILEKSGDSEKTENLINNFISQSKSESDWLTITLLPETDLNKILKNQNITSWSQAVDCSSESLVIISLMTGGDHIKLSFTAPLLSRKNALRYGQMIKRN